MHVYFLVQHDEENKPKRSAIHRPDGHPGRGEQHQRRGDLGQRLEGGRGVSFFDALPKAAL